MGKRKGYKTRLEDLKGSLKSFGNVATVTNKTASFVSESLCWLDRKEGRTVEWVQGLEWDPSLNQTAPKETEKQSFFSTVLYTDSYLLCFLT